MTISFQIKRENTCGLQNLNNPSMLKCQAISKRQVGVILWINLMLVLSNSSSQLSQIAGVNYNHNVRLVHPNPSESHTFRFEKTWKIQTGYEANATLSFQIISTRTYGSIVSSLFCLASLNRINVTACLDNKGQWDSCCYFYKS